MNKSNLSKSRTLGSWGIALLVGSGFVLGSGCGPELSSISKIDSLRILAVRKSAPYAAPGEVVDLEMLWEGARRSDVETFFGFWCVNPPGDLYSGCFQGLPTIVPRFVLNEDRFSLRIPDDILRQPAPGTGGIEFGTAFVFYGVCRGRLEADGDPLVGGGGMGGAMVAAGGSPAGSEGGAPFFGGAAGAGTGGTEPVDRSDLPPGRLLGLPHCVDDTGADVESDRFVIGYSQIFAYDGYRNENPVLRGFELNGEPVEVDCLNSECIGKPAVEEPTQNACEPGKLCLQACTPEAGAACSNQRLEAIIDRSSAEADLVALDAFGTEIDEGLWVSYFTDNGGLGNELRLVNDATRGWNEDQSTKLVPPERPGPVTYWAVVRDNRGGVSFGRVRGYAKK
jgi:hypothetical protein